VNCLKKLAGSGLVLVLAVSTATAWGQTMPQSTASTGSATGNVDSMDQDVALKISQAWSEGKDASGAAAFQENGEIALSEGNQQQARRYFEAAERELARLHPIQTSRGTSAIY